VSLTFSKKATVIVMHISYYTICVAYVYPNTGYGKEEVLLTFSKKATISIMHIS
jgi:hypothetical protein